MAQHATIEELRILRADAQESLEVQRERLARIKQSDQEFLCDVDRNAIFNWDRIVVSQCNHRLSLLEEIKNPSNEEQAIKTELNSIVNIGDHILEAKNLFYTELNDRENAMKKAQGVKPSPSNDEKAESVSTPLQDSTAKSASDNIASRMPDTIDAATTFNEGSPPLSSIDDSRTAKTAENDSPEVARVIIPKLLYKVLQVEPDASLDEVKKAAKKATLRLHPDRNPEDPTASSRFADFQAACQVFESEEKRNEFDNTGDVKAIEDLHLRLEGLLLE